MGVNGPDKGKRIERALCKILAERFGKPFERTVGSGNRWSQVKGMSRAAKAVYVGDLVCPDGFKFVIESKGGYEDKIDFHSIFIKGNTTLDGFLKQVIEDSARCGRSPLLVYKRNLRDWLAFMPTHLMPADIEFDFSLKYKDWTAIALTRLLQAPDDYFFD